MRGRKDSGGVDQTKDQSGHLGGTSKLKKAKVSAKSVREDEGGRNEQTAKKGRETSLSGKN